MAQRFVLDTASHVVEAVFGEAHHMERVGYLVGVGQHLVIGNVVRA